MRLPLSFTDRVPSPIPPSNGKKTSLFTSFGLERLASAIEATRNDNQNGKKFDMEEKRIFSKNTEQVTGNGDTPQDILLEPAEPRIAEVFVLECHSVPPHPIQS